MKPLTTKDDTGPQGGPPTGKWLDQLLDRTERSDPRRVNTILMGVILISSLLMSLLLAAVLTPLIGLDAGRPLHVLVSVIGSVVPLLVGLPAVLFGAALVQKITGMREDLRIALAQATVASRAKTEFLANISHEIRTPMNGVLGMAQVLENTPLTDDQREHLRLVRDSGDMLMAIIDDVLDLSRIEAGRIDLHPAPHPLLRVLADTVGLFQARAEERGTRLTFVVAPGTPEHAVFDSVRVRQCLGNLVSNAVKFTRDGTVTVSLSAQKLEREDCEIILSVQDTGIGISAAALGRLFEAFSQAAATTALDYGGTGLGLPISRRLARLMGGDITVTSTPGEGSCFVLRFRARAMTEAQRTVGATNDPSDPPRLHGVVILVVDDSAVNRRVACGLLSPLGATCHEAAGGAQALELLAECPVDLVLRDMQMPTMDGPATLRALRRSDQPWAGVPVVALTANAMQGERERCLELGMQGSATKPVRQAMLQAEIARSLRQPTSACMAR